MNKAMTLSDAERSVVNFMAYGLRIGAADLVRGMWLGVVKGLQIAGKSGEECDAIWKRVTQAVADELAKDLVPKEKRN